MGLNFNAKKITRVRAWFVQKKHLHSLRERLNMLFLLEKAFGSSKNALKAWKRVFCGYYHDDNDNYYYNSIRLYGVSFSGFMVKRAIFRAFYILCIV